MAYRAEGNVVCTALPQGLHVCVQCALDWISIPPRVYSCLVPSVTLTIIRNLLKRIKKKKKRTEKQLQLNIYSLHHYLIIHC